MNQQLALSRVLVADDDPSIRQLLGTIVRRERLAVDCAADGAEAIALLQQHQYSIIVLDLMMPRVDGFGVIEYLAEHPRDPKPVVLVITAYADQKFKEVDPEVVAGIIRKPFEIAEIGTLVRHCVTGVQSAWQERRRSIADEETLRVLPPRKDTGVGGRIPN